MLKRYLITLTVIILLVGISGCTSKTAQNGTFGEKNISLDKFKITNETADHFNYEDMTYYYIQGNITNLNDIDAINVEMEATAYDKNGSVIATNNTPYLAPKNIPSSGMSSFYFQFNDPNNQIVRYEIKVVSAKPSY